MPNRCYVLGCSTKYESGSPKIPHFKAPTNSFARKKWLDISLRKCPKLKGNIFFCANHFEECDIIKSVKKTFSHPLTSIDIVEAVRKKLRSDNSSKINVYREADVPLKRWKLKPGAYPKTEKGNVIIFFSY